MVNAAMIHVPPPAAALDASDETKRAFAVELVRWQNPWLAAMAVYPKDMSSAMIVEQRWPMDVVVQDHIRKLKTEQNVTVLPTKEDLLRELWKIGKSAEQNPAKIPERLAALRMYAEVSEFMPRGGGGAAIQINNTTNNQPHVLVVPDHGTPEQWMAKARVQQAKLIEAAHGPADDTDAE